MSKKIIKYLKNSIDEKGNYCYSLPVETTKAVIKELERLNNIIDTMLEFSFYCNDIYKKCWLKYFEKLQELKENK